MDGRRGQDASQVPSVPTRTGDLTREAAAWLDWNGTAEGFTGKCWKASEVSGLDLKDASTGQWDGIGTGWPRSDHDAMARGGRAPRTRVMPQRPPPPPNPHHPPIPRSRRWAVTHCPGDTQRHRVCNAIAVWFQNVLCYLNF